MIKKCWNIISLGAGLFWIFFAPAFNPAHVHLSIITDLKLARHTVTDNEEVDLLYKKRHLARRRSLTMRVSVLGFFLYR